MGWLACIRVLPCLGFFLNRDSDSLHLEDRFGYFGAVCSMHEICHPLRRMLKVGSVVLSCIIKDEILGQLFVVGGVFCYGALSWGSPCTSEVIPAATTLAPASVLLTCAPPFWESVAAFCSSLMVAFMDQLFWSNVGDSDSKDCDDDGDW